MDLSFGQGNPNLSASGDKYYIKRLAGTPGDTMKIDDERLLVNGNPATGSIAFSKTIPRSRPTMAISIATRDKPPRDFAVCFEMVKKSRCPMTLMWLWRQCGHSYDSRGWGYVPESMIVGRPVMIFYPFTKRFGLANRYSNDTFGPSAVPAFTLTL